MLFISCFPCGDKVECTNEHVSLSVDAGHPQHDHQNELCSPFCACACCAISVCNFTSQSFELNKRVFAKNIYNQFDASFINDIANAIWQPPQLS